MWWIYSRKRTYMLGNRGKFVVLMMTVFRKGFYFVVMPSIITTGMRIQHVACRIILGLKKFDHISEGLKALNWLRVEDKLFLKDVLMVHKCLHNQAPSYLSDKFVRRSSIHNRATRNSCDLNVPFSRLKTGQRSFAFRGAKLYNNLPNDIKNITDAKVFKRRMLNHLIETSK